MDNGSNSKWYFLQHKGPVFPPPYERLPTYVKFCYDGKEFALSQDAEEVAGFYARMLGSEFTTKPVFQNNFFADWRNVMTQEEKEVITELSKCNFSDMQKHLKRDLAEADKNNIKTININIRKKYGFCKVDEHDGEKVINFKIEKPDLFKPRGEHPKMGKLKKRLMPEDVEINCSINSIIPEPLPNHKWKGIKHNNNRKWLASWTGNVLGTKKYMRLAGDEPQKYKTARELHNHIEEIRQTYRRDWENEDMFICQRAVALYFIDRLALRIGNEKGEGLADTVECCTLRIEHIKLYKEKDNKKDVVVFDFRSKDSIEYHNEVPVERRVFKNLERFMESKNSSQPLFDKLDSTKFTNYSKTNFEMPKLSPKVFRTYTASITMQRELDNGYRGGLEPKKAYVIANKVVAILLNHVDTKTSKLCYIDPRIIFAWCKKHSINENKIYTKMQLERHSWAKKIIKRASYDFRYDEYRNEDDNNDGIDNDYDDDGDDDNDDGEEEDDDGEDD